MRGTTSDLHQLLCLPTQLIEVRLFRECRHDVSFRRPRSAREAQEIVRIDNPASEGNSVLPADPEASSTAKTEINNLAPEFQRGPSG